MARVFSGLAGYKEQVVHLSQTGRSTERSWVHATTDNYFSLLGVQPYLGRFFVPRDVAAPGAEAVIVLTYEAWRSRFGADPAIVGQGIRINAIPFTVIGVAPRGFFGAEWGTALSGFIPATMLTRVLPNGEWYALQRGNTAMFLVGRLRAGATLAQAQAAMDVAFARVMQANPGKYFPGCRPVVMREAHSRPSPYVAQHTPRIVVALTSLGLLVLGIALANTANLLYARNLGREREFAICSALGASRFQLIRRLVIESCVLAMAAGVVGGFAAMWLSPALFSLAPASGNSAPGAGGGGEWRLAVCTAVVSLFAGLLAGILPALKASGRAPLALSCGPTGSVDRRALQSLLVIGQVAVSTLVLVCALAAVRSVRVLTRADLGFRTGDMLLVSFDVAAQKYSQKRGEKFAATLLDQVRALPGVEAASLAHGVPLDGGITMFGGVAPNDDPAKGEGVSVPVIRVEHTYLSTIGMTLVTGRDFAPQDTAKAPPVAIVNRSLAEAFWPGRDAVGQAIKIQGRTAQVVGVVNVNHYYAMRDSNRPLLIVPLAQDYRGDLTLVVRAANATLLRAPVTAIVRQLDPDLPVFNFRTMEQQVQRSAAGLMPYRLGAILAGFQGLVALVLAGAGIFSLIAFGVARRTREIGIRVALGATRLAIIRVIARHSVALTAVGLVIGVTTGAILVRVFANLLVAGAADLLLFTAVALVITLVAAVACWLPLRRATRIDPIEALRTE